jgi:hypothetical protein
MRSFPGVLLINAVFVFFIILPAPGAQTSVDKQIKAPVAESIRVRQATQKNEEQWRDDRQKLIARFEQLELDQQRFSARKSALEEKTAAAVVRITAKEKQLTDIETIQTRIVPMIDNLVVGLRRYLDHDLPFLPDERQKRLAHLEALRLDPDVPVSEKFRKVMEALLIEAEYGNTIEVYQQTITVDGHDMLVNIFRLGRISLFFQTLDSKTCGVFNVAASAWQTLPVSFNNTIQTAMDIGVKRQPAEILNLPLGRMNIQ